MAMVTSVAVAIAVAHGMPVIGAAVILAALWDPVVAGLVVIALGLVAGHSDPLRVGATGEARFLAAVSAELRSGATVRQAIVDAAARAPELELAGAVRRAEAGVDGDRLGRTIAAQLPISGSLVGPAVRMAIASGGRAAPIFERLALRTQDRAELENEVEVATAQVRLSVRVLVAMPALLVAMLAITGHLGRLAAAGSLGVWALVAGAILEAAGIAVVLLLLRRTVR